MPVSHQKLGRGKEAFPYRFQREHGPADTLIAGFQPPGMRENKLPLLYATLFVVLCYGSLKEITYLGINDEYDCGSAAQPVPVLHRHIQDLTGRTVHGPRLQLHGPSVGTTAFNQLAQLIRRVYGPHLGIEKIDSFCCFQELFF